MQAPAPLAPEMGPECTFTKPMKAHAQRIPDPIKQSTIAPLIAGFSSV